MQKVIDSSALLTDRQKEVLDALRSYIFNNQRAPTFKELSGIVGYKCTDALLSLKKRHIITWGKRSARSLTILNKHTSRTLARVTSASRVQEAPGQVDFAGRVLESIRMEDASTTVLRFTDQSQLRIAAKIKSDAACLEMTIRAEFPFKAPV